MSSRTGTLYIGMTNSIYRRALQHKRGEIEGFSSKYHCNRLVHYESFDDVHKAIAREKQLKGWLRAKKIALIESRNPRWADLAEKWGAEMLFAGEPIKEKTGTEEPARFTVSSVILSEAKDPIPAEANTSPARDSLHEPLRSSS